MEGESHGMLIDLTVISLSISTTPPSCFSVLNLSEHYMRESWVFISAHRPGSEKSEVEIE